MTSIRWLGLAVGVLGLLAAFYRFRRGRARRIDFVSLNLVSLGLAVVSVWPGSVGFLRDLLMLEEAQFSRLIALGILSNIALWALVFHAQFRLDRHAEQFDRLVRQTGLQAFARSHPDLAVLPPLLVVIPAYDEEENIGAILAATPRRVGGLEAAVLVIDDGSEDLTAERAAAGGALVVRNPFNRGGGAALRLGFDVARAYGARIVVTMDGDGQHDPAEIPVLAAPVEAGEADVVIGSRILGRHEPDSRVRYLGVRVFSALIRLLARVRVTDCSSGFRALRTGALDRLLLRQDQFHTSELIIDAARKGLRIREVPVTIRRRRSGASKKGPDWRYGLSFFRAVLRTWWR